MMILALECKRVRRRSHVARSEPSAARPTCVTAAIADVLGRPSASARAALDQVSPSYKFTDSMSQPPS